MLYKEKPDIPDSKSQNQRKGILPQLRMTSGVINQNSEINGNLSTQNKRLNQAGNQIVYANLNPSRNKELQIGS